jgi:hypothetical protein
MTTPLNSPGLPSSSQAATSFTLQKRRPRIMRAILLVDSAQAHDLPVCEVVHAQVVAVVHVVVDWIEFGGGAGISSLYHHMH